MLIAAARWLHTLGFALWLGGLVAIGALVAPTAFRVIPHNPALAGGIVGGSLRVFNVLCLVSGAVMLLADVLLWRRWPRPTRLCAVLTLALLVLTVYLQWGLFPALDAAQAAGHHAAFALLHARYERLSGWELPLLLVIAGADAVRAATP